MPNQCYLVVLYRALFALAYYGMMHIGELTQAPGCHAVKAKNVHVGQNKDKIKLVLFTSKTHGRGSYPQYIKIRALPQYFLPSAKRARFFYPFDLVDRFIQLCGSYDVESENLFIFRDKAPVLPQHVWKLLQDCLTNLSLDASLYDCHSIRIGQTCYMAKDQIPFLKMCSAGQWKLNAVYRYLRN